ncbi:MAG: nitrilase family protein [Muribaculaceae bacterium]|nr:nitrilase family protein [Muribaculaceae bacterium]
MATNNLNICLFPMELIWNDTNVNIGNLEKALEDLHPHTDLVILPETFLTGYPSNSTKEHIKELIQRNGDTVLDRIKMLARNNNVAITGSLIIESDERLFNRAFFIEPTGDVYYADKKHLFSMAGEDRIFNAGNKRLKVRFRGWNISLIVCYDIRFPVWCRNRGNEYDFLIVVANWPKVRIDAWNKLLPARAIENTAYVAGVNCKGIDDHNYEYDGTSHIYDFKGKEIGVKVGSFIYASLAHDKLDKFRDKFPVWKDADKFWLEN